jgi:hypothetical protein
VSTTFAPTPCLHAADGGCGTIDDREERTWRV